MLTASFAATLDPAATLAFAAAPEIHAAGLAIAAEELARLRFEVLLTARWESGEEDSERRKELLGDLAGLRRLYYDKIDRIAMAFGVVHAMRAQAEVERSVAIPPEPHLIEPSRVDDGLYF